jgi:hypothetical protein
MAGDRFKIRGKGRYGRAGGADAEHVRYGCDAITRNARSCRRPATRHFERFDGAGDRCGTGAECIAHYCAQHANGGGIMRLLLPAPWEYNVVRTYGGAG